MTTSPSGRKPFEDAPTLTLPVKGPGGTAVGLPLTTLGADPEARVPFVFGHEIARGGMGSIIEADDKKLGRKIAVKVMLLEAHADDAQRQRASWCRRPPCSADWNIRTLSPSMISVSTQSGSFTTR